jgi:acyl-CoA synthetase (AMP-forming)/AMP-acid ligase II
MIYRSPHPRVTIPECPLPEYLFEHAQGWSTKPALIDGPTGRTLTYGELAASTRRLAAGLAARGFRKGDTVAIFSPNIPEYAIAFLGVATAGGINTTINPLSSVGELRRYLELSAAKYLIVAPLLLDTAREATKGTAVSELFVLGESEEATPFTDLLADTGQDSPPIDIDAREDLVALPFSSGTTGFAKGVMLTHYNLVANLTQIDLVEQLAEGEVLIGFLPFYHIYGMVVLMCAALRKGASIVTMPRFDLEQFLGLIQTYRVTTAYLVPPVVLALAKHPAVDQYDLSSLNNIMSGAAPLPESVATLCATRNDIRVRQGYGLTESSPVTNTNPRYGEIKITSVGPALPNTEFRIVDSTTSNDVPTGELGEIWVRGPQVMKGYFHNEEATREMIDEDGWLHTGDVGRADSDGFLYVVDRLKELIKYKGFQVAPAELEAILLSHPEVSDVAVIPSPDDEAGEVPKAFVVRRPAATVSAEILMAFVAERLSPQKKVRRVEFIDTIPKSGSGKILRRELVEREREATAASTDPVRPMP